MDLKTDMIEGVLGLAFSTQRCTGLVRLDSVEANIVLMLEAS